ncbi:alcohol dehydrogenase GroES-like domain-containing protein [Colletotrichum karsti]|uniref:L-arabinitol 4-dehydrogenase n=1 Tax=Colletotrichum karsti TaxID=1095194 RepID=A0A9P6I1G0_9PEZI|nr:alcohol dehydrogenase GroES-like domain-containing protein [Colletotrichum karsti]KAF9874314.1 alcohol dehydrogenase GroES-like domain-containing protein [Colletotrichum karsti]
MATAEMQNPSWLLYGPKSAKLQDRPIPTISDDHEVIVRIKYVGVCGSDVHFWQEGGFMRKVSDEKPLVMGHEAAGIIDSIGTGVTSVKVGDRVAIEPGFPCRRCKNCKDGVYNLCPRMQFAADPPDNHGALAKYFVVPEDFVYRVPDEVSLEEAVLVEPTAVAVHSARLAGISFGQDVVVTGSGTIGLLSGAVAKAFGARRVILVDILEKKLEFARSFVECETFLADTKTDSEDIAAQILKKFGLTEGVDAVIEASGAQSSIQTGIYLLKRGGSYVQAGLGKARPEVPMLALSEKELKVRGCFRYGSGDYELALSLISQGRINTKALLSSVTSFENATAAWDKTANGEGIKNLIEGVKD